MVIATNAWVKVRALPEQRLAVRLEGVLAFYAGVLISMWAASHSSASL